MVASLPLTYPATSAPEQLRAALVRLIDVVRANVPGDVASSLDDIRTDIGGVETSLADAEASITALQAAFGDLVAEALTAQQLFEIALDHAREDVQGSRAEFERWIQDEHIRLMESVIRLRQLVQNNAAQIIDEQVVRVSENEAFAQTITGVTADLADTTALVLTEQTARATADEALATDITALEASVGTNTASINTLSSTVTTLTSATAASITALQAEVDAAEASVTTEALARAAADDALAGSITTLTATVASNAAAITSEALTRATEDTALAALIDTVEATVASNTAAITAEAIARADEDTALAASVSTVSTTVGGHTTSITTMQASIDGVQAQWGVSINVDGHVTGTIQMDGTGETSAVTIVADSFLVANPTDSGDIVPVFGVGSIDGVAGVGILGNAIIDGSVLARHITVGSLDAISANIGTITAGIIQSPGGETYWNLTTGEHRFAYYTDWLETLESTVTAADVALNAAVTDILASVGQLESDVAALDVEGLSAQDRFEIALDHAIDTVSGSRAEFEVWIQDELRRVAELALQVRRHTTDNAALITTEQVARVSETETLASQLTALTADLASTNAAVVTEQLARATGDSALASSITTVEAGIASNTASITTLSTVQTGIQSDVTTLQSDVTGIETDLGQVEAQWGVAINVNGQVTGLVRMDAGASGSQFVVVADKFIVAHPSAPGTVITPVVVGLVNGVSTVGINGTLVVDGTILARHIAANQIDASHINVANLAAINANLGTVTAGLIRDPSDTYRFAVADGKIGATDDSAYFDAKNKRLRIVS